MENEINAMFKDYQNWYKSVWLKELINSQDEDYKNEFIEDFEEYGWMDALGKLNKIDSESLLSFEKINGSIPECLTNLFLNIGTGTILTVIEDEEEALEEHEIIHPKDFKEEKANMLSWIDEDRFSKIKKNYNFNKENFVPFLKLENCCWVFFVNNDSSDDKVYVFDHAVENGIDEIFREYKSFKIFFQEYFKSLKEKDPMNS